MQLQLCSYLIAPHLIIQTVIHEPRYLIKRNKKIVYQLKKAGLVKKK